MIKGKTFYLDRSALENRPTNFGWDTITFCERTLWRKRVLATGPNTAKVTVYDYQWSAICKANDEVCFENICEEDFIEEANFQYTMTPPKKKPAKKSIGGKLSGGERRVIDVLTSRSNAIKTERLSELCGVKTNTLHTYVSSLRAKGYEIIQRHRRYLPLKKGAN